MRPHAEPSTPRRQSGASTVRIEHDLLGEHALPAAAHYGIHTARALANFDIPGDTIARYPLLRQIEDAAIAQTTGVRCQATRAEVPAR